MKFLHGHRNQIQMMSHTGGCRTDCAGQPVCRVRACWQRWSQAEPSSCFSITAAIFCSWICVFMCSLHLLRLQPSNTCFPLMIIPTCELLARLFWSCFLFTIHEGWFINNKPLSETCSLSDSYVAAFPCRIMTYWVYALMHVFFSAWLILLQCVWLRANIPRKNKSELIWAQLRWKAGWGHWAIRQCECSFSSSFLPWNQPFLCNPAVKCCTWTAHLSTNASSLPLPLLFCWAQMDDTVIGYKTPWKTVDLF